MTPDRLILLIAWELALRVAVHGWTEADDLAVLGLAMAWRDVGGGEEC
jgi:hypothetical protein